MTRPYLTPYERVERKRVMRRAAEKRRNDARRDQRLAEKARRGEGGPVSGGATPVIHPPPHPPHSNTTPPTPVQDSTVQVVTQQPPPPVKSLYPNVLPGEVAAIYMGPCPNKYLSYVRVMPDGEPTVLTVARSPVSAVLSRNTKVAVVRDGAGWAIAGHYSPRGIRVLTRAEQARIEQGNTVASDDRTDNAGADQAVPAGQPGQE